MKLFHVDLIFMLEIEGEGLPAKQKKFRYSDHMLNFIDTQKFHWNKKKI